MDLTTEPQPLERSLLELEGRVRALEQTVSSLQDTRQVEERIAERVSAQLPRVSAAAVVEAFSSKPLPPAVKSLVEAAAQPSTLKQVARSSWLVFNMVQELVNVGRMLLDRHYHMAWITRFLVVLLLIGIVTSSLWLNWLAKVFDLLLAGVLFLALFCETGRYKEWRAKTPNA